VSEQRRELLADWLIVIGAVALFVSLFLTWSHQFSPAFLAVWGSSQELRGIPHDPTAWQVYSTVDVLLGLVAASLIVVALLGGRALRLGAIVAVGVALAIALHALSAAPTDGADVLGTSLTASAHSTAAPAAGAGETVAVVGSIVALAGLTLSLSTE
jgi:hypothetical protein